MFWQVKSPLDAGDEEWQIDCWQWLLEHFGGLQAFRQHRLILPTKEFFPATKLGGHDRALHIFNIIAGHMGIEPQEFELVPQDAPVDPVLDRLMVVQNSPTSPAGTFEVRQDGKLCITYDPTAVEKPLELVATLVHELCHPLLLSVSEPPPGGNELEEFATDLAVTFFGFGVFGANNAFAFEQHHDAGTGTQGWSTRRMGYLSEAEWGFSLAVFLTLQDRSVEDALKYLDDTPATEMKKSLKYLGRHSEILQELLE